MPESPVLDDVAQDKEQWRTVDPLILLPTAGKVRLLSPTVSKRLTVTSQIGQLLLMAQSGIPRIPDSPVFDWSTKKYVSVTQALASYGYLLSGPASDGLGMPWQAWGPLAWAYHDAATNPSIATAEQAGPGPADLRPSSFRSRHDKPVLLLPRLSPRTSMRFVDVLEQRRTHRDFQPASVTIEAFSDILRYTFGPLRFADAGPLGVLQLRAAASGGARHETEAYVYVFAVDGIVPGLYSYDTLVHGLVSVRCGELRQEAERLTIDQGFFRESAFGVVTVAMTDRMSWKYHNASAYRVLWQNIGHIAQIFSMLCTSVELGAALTGAIRVPEARDYLGLTACSDIVTFAMACGQPRLAQSGLPLSIRGPSRPFKP